MIKKEYFDKATCNDIISRQAAIAVADYVDNTGLAIEDVKKVTDEVIKGLKQLPPVTPVENPNKWIFVSERYPTDTNKCYLVCYEDGCITIEYLYINDDEEPFFSEMELGVLAWMPLPEPPYKASPTGAEGSEE